MKSIAAPDKIGLHHQKVQDYLAGSSIFPVTLELDITSDCTMQCADCPNSRNAESKSLDINFIERLFDSFEGQTRGLLLTGGEPTMSPLFPKVLKMARDKGFENIAVVTNGSLLHKESVIEALTNYATTIRISLYHWEKGLSSRLESELRKVNALNEQIRKCDSDLQIGISALTSQERVSHLQEITYSVKEAGADWIYFHPMCHGWNDAKLMQYDQKGVTNIINSLQNKYNHGFNVYFSDHRYRETKLRFSSYHAAHFLMIVGADGINYLGAEVKYNPGFVLADLKEDLNRGYLHKAERMRRISGYNSNNYKAVNSRHRGVLYNDFMEYLKENDETCVLDQLPDEKNFKFPHIL